MITGIYTDLPLVLELWLICFVAALSGAVVGKFIAWLWFDVYIDGYVQNKARRRDDEAGQ